MSRAVYTAQIGWAGQTIGQFVLGFSTFDSTDTLGQSFTQDFSGVYSNVTGYTNSMTWTRGRTDDLGPIQAGQATLVLKDPAGIFNPANTGSPLAGSVTPLRPVKITATFQGATSVLFSGFIRSIEHNPAPNDKTTTIEAIDLFVWLTRAKPVVASTGATTVAAAVGLVLDAIGWTEPTLRSLAGSDTIPDFSSDGTTTALDLIQALLQVDPGGMFFVDGAGRAVYLSRHILALEATDATFDRNMMAIGPGTSLDTVQNRAAVTREGGAEQAAQNAASIHQYGYSDIDAVTSPYLVNDDQALGLATYLVALRGSPLPPIYSLTLNNGTDATLAQILGREIGDRVAVTASGAIGGTTGDFIVQQVTHTVTDAGSVHTCQMALATRYAGPAPIVLDTTLMDSTPAVFIY